MSAGEKNRSSNCSRGNKKAEGTRPSPFGGDPGTQETTGSVGAVEGRQAALSGAGKGLATPTTGRACSREVKGQPWRDGGSPERKSPPSLNVLSRNKEGLRFFNSALLFT